MTNKLYKASIQSTGHCGAPILQDQETQFSTSCSMDTQAEFKTRGELELNVLTRPGVCQEMLAYTSSRMLHG
jgi:hypothetical protein